VVSHPMKAPCVSVVDFGLLHVDPPVLTPGGLCDWRLRLFLCERLWDAAVSTGSIPGW